MALTITQETDFRVIVPTVTNVDLLLRPGHSISNTSRAGEGIVTKYTSTGFGEGGGCSDFTILVVSGTFLNGDSFTCTPTGAGTISIVTAAAHPGILVSGTMADTNSTTNTNETLDLTAYTSLLDGALDASQTNVIVDDSSEFSVDDYIRIESEYMKVIKINSDTETLTVSRGEFVTTKATHVDDTAIYEVDTNITVLDSTKTPAGSIIRIDDTTDEYCFVEVVISATSIDVKRGFYGTIGTHATAKDIYIVDTDLCEQIFDADVAGTWGYSSCSNGRLEMDCTIIVGSPQQTSDSILITTNELIDLSQTVTNQWLQFGQVTYRSYVQNGLGFMSEIEGDWDGVGFASTKIITASDVAFLFVTGVGCTSYFFGSELVGVPNFRGKVLCYDLSITDENDKIVVFQQVEQSRMYNTKLGFCAINTITTLLEVKKMKVYAGGIYWLFSFGGATLTEMETDERVIGSGFLTGGTKTQIDCKTAPYFGIFGTFAHIFDNFKSVTANVIDEKGNALEGVTCVANYRINSTANIYSELTDESGELAKQLIRFAIVELTPSGFTTGAPTNPTLTRDVEFFFRKSGYQEVRKRLYIEDRDDPIVFKDIVLKKNRFRETKSRGGI